MIKLEMTAGSIQTLIRTLDHVIGQTNGSGQPLYAIDALCRSDCRARFRGLRLYLNGRLPKKSRFT